MRVMTAHAFGPYSMHGVDRLAAFEQAARETRLALRPSAETVEQQTSSRARPPNGLHVPGGGRWGGPSPPCSGTVFSWADLRAGVALTRLPRWGLSRDGPRGLRVSPFLQESGVTHRSSPRHATGRRSLATPRFATGGRSSTNAVSPWTRA